MLRRLLSLLLVLPLLLPQGVCACDFIEHQEAGTTVSEAAPPPACCARCRKHWHSHTTAQTKQPAPVSHSDQDSPCPTKAGGGLWKAAPAGTHVLSTADVLPVSFRTVLALPDPTSSPDLLRSDRTLYLTLLNLRI